MSSQPAAWHPDPFGRHQLRYWDGRAWTAHVANSGVSSTDPPFPTPTPVAAAAPAAPAATPVAAAARPSVVSVGFTRAEYIEIVEGLMFVRRTDPSRWAARHFLDKNLTWICSYAPDMDERSEEPFNLTLEEVVEWTHFLQAFPANDEHSNPEARQTASAKVADALRQLGGGV